jgi:hypothetical protein
MVVNEVPTNEVEQAGGERIPRQPVRVTSRLVATATFGPELPVTVSIKWPDSGPWFLTRCRNVRPAYTYPNDGSRCVQTGRKSG